MMKKKAALIFLLLAAGLGVLFYMGNAEKKSAGRVPGTIVYQIPGMEKVKVAKDIIYKKDKELEQKLDVYYPLKKGFGNKPCPVILIHGGTKDRNFKDKGYFDSWGRLIAAYGFSAVTFNWRYGTAPEDISDLIAYVREHSEELGVDGTGMSIIAFSAGVENGVKEALSADNGTIDSIVAYYGKLPLSVVKNKPENELPPFFIARAGLDKNFAPDCNKEFMSIASGLGCDITEVVHEEGVHGFDLFTDDDRSREIIRESLAFIEAKRKK